MSIQAAGVGSWLDDVRAMSAPSAVEARQARCIAQYQPWYCGLPGSSLSQTCQEAERSVSACIDQMFTQPPAPPTPRPPANWETTPSSTAVDEVVRQSWIDYNIAMQRWSEEQARIAENERSGSGTVGVSVPPDYTMVLLLGFGALALLLLLKR